MGDMMCFIVLISFIFYYLMGMLWRFFKTNKFEKFGDLLSLTNCSLIVFDTERSCHFIYGKSSFGDIDVPN